jgi:hypothetical protein
MAAKDKFEKFLNITDATHNTEHCPVLRVSNASCQQGDRAINNKVDF